MKLRNLIWIFILPTVLYAQTQITGPTILQGGPPGPQGTPGTPGTPGVGVPLNGTPGQVTTIGGTGSVPTLIGNTVLPMANTQKLPALLNDLCVTPLNSYGLVYNGTNWACGPYSAFLTLAGDVTGSGTSNTVVKVNGGSIPTSKTIVGTNSSGQLVDASSATLTNNTSGNAATATLATTATSATTATNATNATNAINATNATNAINVNGPVFDSGGAVINVKSRGAKCDGSTDDTAAIQAALNVSGNIHVTIPYSATSCIISDVLLVHSNTWLEVDPNTKIYEASGNNVEMLRNVNLTQTITDTNIRVSGGIWDMNWVGNPGVRFRSTSYFMMRSSKTSPVEGASGVLGFYGVQYLWLDGITVQDARNFSIQIAQSQDWHAKNSTFVRTQATGSDGIHVNGPSARFDISGVYGATGDDFVALNASDWTNSTPNSTAGDITDGTISVLRPNTAVWGVNKMCVDNRGGVYRVNFNDVKGTSINGGFIWGTFADYSDTSHIPASLGTVGQIRLNDIAINVTTGSTAAGWNGTTDNYGSVVYLAGNVQDVVFDGVTMDATHLPASGKSWLYQKAGTSATSITASNFRSSVSTPTAYWFDNVGSISHFALTSGDSQGTPATSLASTLVRTETGGSISTLETGGGYVSAPSGNLASGNPGQWAVDGNYLYAYDGTHSRWQRTAWDATWTPASSLVAFWKFAEGTGTTSADSSLSANNLTLTGTSWVAQTGLSSGGLSYAGTAGSHADPSGYTGINFDRLSPFSISTWFVLNNATGVPNPRIISRLVAGAGGGGYDIGFNYNSPNWLFAFELANTDGVNSLSVVSAVPITEGVLHHIVVTYNGSSSVSGVVAYLDGVSLGLTTATNNLTSAATNTTIPRIGTRISGSTCTTCYFNGVLGPLAIWNRVLTAAEDTALQANPYLLIN